jgi:hypothetical protein
MKRSQKGCRGCEVKATGASTWQVGFVVGQHYMSVLASAAEDEDPDYELCALHMRLARDAYAVAMAFIARRGAARIAAGGSESESKPPQEGA